MPWTYCPECDARILVPRSARMGDLLECPECNETLEVINLDPLELETACGLREDLLLGLEGVGNKWTRTNLVLSKRTWTSLPRKMSSEAAGACPDGKRAV